MSISYYHWKLKWQKLILIAFTLISVFIHNGVRMNFAFSMGGPTARLDVWRIIHSEMIQESTTLVLEAIALATTLSGTKIEPNLWTTVK